MKRGCGVGGGGWGEGREAGWGASQGKEEAGRGGTWAERRVKGSISPSTTSHVALLTGSTTSARACGGPQRSGVATRAPSLRAAPLAIAAAHYFERQGGPAQTVHGTVMAPIPAR